VQCRTLLGASALRFVRTFRKSPMDDIEIHRIDHRSSDAVIALFEAQLREHQITVSTKSLREAVSIVVDSPRYGFILLAMARDGAAVGVASACQGAQPAPISHGRLLPITGKRFLNPRRISQFTSISFYSV
jgi:hypothetical protein